MPSVLWFAVWVLAVARVTGLATADRVGAPARAWLVALTTRWRRTHAATVYTFGSPDDDIDGCSWCVSMWIGLVSAAPFLLWHEHLAVRALIAGLAASQITGIIHAAGRE